MGRMIPTTVTVTESFDILYLQYFPFHFSQTFQIQMLANTSLGLLRLRLTVPVARAMSDKTSDGAIKEEGGSFGKKGEADENAYFHKLGREQLGNIKKDDSSGKKEDPNGKGEEIKKK